jgi:hypothetical protein
VNEVILALRNHGLDKIVNIAEDDTEPFSSPFGIRDRSNLKTLHNLRVETRNIVAGANDRSVALELELEPVSGSWLNEP